MQKNLHKIITIAAIAAAIGINTVFAQSSVASNQINAFLSQIKILRELEQGMNGEDVKLLQAVLATQPDVYPEGTISGFFGPITVKAVKKYQEKFGISTIGRVGPITQKKLNEYINYNISNNLVGSANSGSEKKSIGMGVKIASEICVKIPPEHQISAQWLKDHKDTADATCQPLPNSIARRLEFVKSVLGTASVSRSDSQAY